ncbi:hypothetical protein [Leisingera sp. M523]|uniref:hypothetical protein n=1 Tax=Leisingera sp. M523 TaxID=2867013 RepID=UPI0021A5A615|nr:hypothetical protein [Leisingera sp. M523]
MVRDLGIMERRNTRGNRPCRRLIFHHPLICLENMLQAYRFAEEYRNAFNDAAAGACHDRQKAEHSLKKV